jgi:hypothetical protein
MPTISTFRGIRAYAEYAGESVIVDINGIEVLDGKIPNKQLKMLLGWAALHQEELLENWELASKGEETFEIAPLA